MTDLHSNDRSERADPSSSVQSVPATMSQSQDRAGVGRLARASGALAMVAVDQRDSLRVMFRAAGGEGSDRELRDFKMATATHLGNHCSAMLFDTAYGLGAAELLAQAPAACGLILAVDELEYDPTGKVVRTRIDQRFAATITRATEATGELSPDAYKLLVLWDDATRGECEALAAEFMDLSRAAGVVGLLEVKLRDAAGHAAGNRALGLIDAARAMSKFRPDVYKTEVPFLGQHDDATIASVCEEITEAIACPWVVLSSGVPVEAFPHAVACACRGGASGFLAGRAIWSDAVHPTQYAHRLATEAVDRLRRLVDAVESARILPG